MPLYMSGAAVRMDEIRSCFSTANITFQPLISITNHFEREQGREEGRRPFSLSLFLSLGTWEPSSFLPSFALNSALRRKEVRRSYSFFLSTEADHFTARIDAKPVSNSSFSTSKLKLTPQSVVGSNAHH